MNTISPFQFIGWCAFVYTLYRWQDVTAYVGREYRAFHQSLGDVVDEYLS